MKHTKIAGFVLGLIIGMLWIKSDIWAFELEPIKKIPLFTLAPTAISTNTPTVTPGEPNTCNGTCGSNYNCKGDLFCYKGYCRNPECPSESDCQCATSLTVTPTKNITVTTTPSSTAEITSTEPTSEPKPTETLTPTITTAPAKTQSENLTMWFLIITIGLLAMIIVIQAWPRKEKEEENNGEE